VLLEALALWEMAMLDKAARGLGQFMGFGWKQGLV
jgi:hypothetical protein